MISNNQDDAPNGLDREAEKRLKNARAAAKRFCRQFSFPQHYVEHLEGDPIQKPLLIDRDGVRVEVFRWLGHGRGAPYVQVELEIEGSRLTVYGGFKGREFGPWKPAFVGGGE